MSASHLTPPDMVKQRARVVHPVVFKQELEDKIRLDRDLSMICHRFQLGRPGTEPFSQSATTWDVALAVNIVPTSHCGAVASQEN
mmetsp:Transcript_97857/g.315040  ORF Transcript_97857/g.315040 Transcript_97857/m.315040 type:complete len:85 (-) Transcript_97857:311-565(-)